MSDQQAEIITTLLDRICDAVVCLDADLRMIQPSPSLEAMLQASPNSMHKRCFVDLFPAHDVEHVRKELQESSQHRAGCLHTSMFDSRGLVVRVQAFHTHTQSMIGEIVRR